MSNFLRLRFLKFVCTLFVAFAFLNVCIASISCVCISRCLYALYSWRLIHFEMFVCILLYFLRIVSRWLPAVTNLRLPFVLFLWTLILMLNLVFMLLGSNGGFRGRKTHRLVTFFNIYLVLLCLKYTETKVIQKLKGMCFNEIIIKLDMVSHLI